jgi:signal transduction histidine kinase
MKALSVAILAFYICPALPAQNSFAAEPANAIQIQTLIVDGKQKSLPRSKSLSLGSSPQNISFSFGPETNSGQAPFRIRYRLEGRENNWNEGGAWMYLAIRFYNDSGDQISQSMFKVVGDSAGWNGSLKKPTLAHRRETVIVPQQASRVWVVISSAGPPDVVGIYVVANLVVSKSSSKLSPDILIQSPFDNHRLNDASNYPTLSDWARDGNIPSMAKIIKFGQDPEQTAFAIVDDNLTSHAEWHTAKESAPMVTPGEQLVVEWNEMYSMGIGGIHQAAYHDLPTGTYHFHVVGLNAMGIPSGAEDALTILVPQIFWKTSWFRVGLLFAFFIVVGGSWRYVALQRMRREMLHLKNQQALERERLRIAHDIHDDLGARVTQISLLSAMSQGNSNFPEMARTNFEQISQMSRELVSALYQTVWAVNPENDNLDALGNYICQMVNQLCDRVPFRCRFHVEDMPREIQVSSQIRHNISMAVKEAVHNVIKHAKASEVKINVEYTGNLLTVSVQDDGCGFQPADNVAGNGLGIMKRRLADIGGSCSFESCPGRGTAVRMCLTIPSTDKNLIK